MSKKALMFAGIVAVLALVVPAGATVIGFETTEGYASGDLASQPGTPPGGTQWSLYYGDGGDIEVAAGVGVGDTAALKIDLVHDSYDRYLFETGAPEIGAFDPDASVVNYSWKFKRDDGGATSDNRRLEFWVGMWGCVTQVGVRSGNNLIVIDYGGGSMTVAGIDGWNTFDVTARWRPAAETETFDISINGVSVGTFDFRFQHWSGSPGPPSFLLLPKNNGLDGQLGYVDDVTIVSESTLTPGDANGDGSVDLQDFGLLKANFGTTGGATWAMGDFNGDENVDLQDFGLLKANFGTGGAGEGERVPEPATLGFMAMGALFLRRRRV